MQPAHLLIRLAAVGKTSACPRRSG